MNQRQKIFAMFTLFLSGCALLTVFQNCGGFESGYNPLFDSNFSSYCLGINCQRDLNQAIFKTNTTSIQVDNNSGSSSCDASNCFDVGGYCETGGYPNSVFIYQWKLAGQTPDAEVRTSAACDETGRFHFRVMVPFGRYDWTKMHTLRVYMKVIDESGAELVNPSGANEWSYVVSTRS